MGSRNYSARGEQCHNAKLTEDDVRLMRALHEEGLNNREISEKFETNRKTVWEITSYRNWRHI